LWIVLKIYFHYLEIIGESQNKIFIFSDELLKKLSDNNNLTEMSFQFEPMELTNFSVFFKNFIDCLKCLNVSEIKQEIQNFMNIYETMNEKLIFNTKYMLELMKNIYEKLKSRSKDLDFLMNIFQNFKKQIETLENIQNTHKIKIRAYSSICYFIHSIYSNNKIEKFSVIVHPILNLLKKSTKEGVIFSRYLVKLLYSVNNVESVGKIIFSFFENSLTSYSESDMLSQLVEFKPIKYFFGEFAKFEKYIEIQKIIQEYRNNLTTQNNHKNVIDKKIMILIFLISFVKIPTYCIDFGSFIRLVNSQIENNSLIVKMISRVLLNYTKIFSDRIDLSLIISTIFSKISESQSQPEILSFFFNLLENLITLSDLFSLESACYLFEILKFINSRHIQVRSIATTIFSRLMKVVTMLKMDESYESISSESSRKSLQNIKSFFNQNSIKYEELRINLKEQLRSYQITGINWMQFMGENGMSVALCDDMGLGKTIQTLVCVVNSSRIYKENTGKNPTSLIICPNTLILNWINESKKFFSPEDVLLSKLENMINMQELKKGAINSNENKIEIFITSYDRIRDCSEYLANEDLFYLVLDEAHIIKNPKTKMYQSIKRLQSERRVILTGTPIQNNVMELWALFELLMPGFLGSENDFEIKFHKKIHSNIKKLNLEEKLQENIFQTSLNEIRKRIKPFVLRRLKQDVLKELPDKIIQDYMCEMTEVQKELYKYYDKIYSNTNSLKKTKIKFNTLKLIDILRKICNYPGLLAKDEIFIEGESELRNKLKKENILDFNSSCKFKALEDLLISLNFTQEKEASNTDLISTVYENKILIFSQFKTMVEKIGEMLSKQFSHLRVLKITSDYSNEQRISTVNNFNLDSSINILILTTSIGGLGLSLTSANIVIMYDHDWNPMRDLQAMDRAHRIGQKKTVEVFRLITADSIEEKLISLQTFKKYIANNVVDKTNLKETGINANNFMNSLEEFSSDKIILRKNKKKTKDSTQLHSEEENEKELLEIENLQKLLDN
jgi:SNF2 family DNA or RNA helicase